MSATNKVLQLLRQYESPNVTYMDDDGLWPIVWERARGVHVWDVEGKKYLDLTGAFGVAAAGHANVQVVRAGATQMRKLLHAMGDVHPHALKAELARELSRITFERWTKGPVHGERRTKVEKPALRRGSAKTIFCNSGFETIEAAFKTAMLATGKSGVIAFNGAYHGLGYGALNATHRDHFRTSFRSQLRQFTHFAPFPTRPGDMAEMESVVRHFFRRTKIGAVLVEPIQARGGINIPPPEFLPRLREICDEHEALLILDEVYTGFGRTGKWFACEHSGVIPDLICLGKALTGGFPLSACVGRADIMDTAWPRSAGEAIHTSTFLGHPVGCAMALAQIGEIRRLKLVERSARLGRFLQRELRLRLAKMDLKDLRADVRGVGMMAGVELTTAAGRRAMVKSLAVIKQLLQEGFIFLPEGEEANVVSFTPPLTITERQLSQACAAFVRALE